MSNDAQSDIRDYFESKQTKREEHKEDEEITLGKKPNKKLKHETNKSQQARTTSLNKLESIHNHATKKMEDVTRRKYGKDKNLPNIRRYASGKRFKSRQFVDITIKTNNCNIPANKLILSSCSKYFEEECLKATERNEDEISISNLDESSIKKIVEYCYTGEIFIEHDVYNLLQAAKILEMKKIKSYCVKFLKSNLHVTNCIDVYDAAVEYGENSLKETAESFITENITKKGILKIEGYKSWTFDTIRSFIPRLSRYSVTQNEIFAFICNWIDHDSRNEAYSHIYLLVQINDLDEHELEKYFSRLNSGEKTAEASGLFEMMTEGSSKSKIALSLGGLFTERMVKEVPLCCEPFIGKYPDLPIGGFWSCATAVKDIVYFISGWNKERLDRQIAWKIDFNNTKPKWEKLPELIRARHQASAAVFQESLVVVGGRKFHGEGRDILRSGEYLSHDSWNAIAPLKQARAQHDVVTCKQTLYAIGGYDESGNALSSCESLVKLDDEWNDIQEMQTKRFGFAAVECDGYIYAFGGRKDRSIKVLKSAERYDAEKNKWSYISDMNFRRTAFSACVLEGIIYVVGGWDGEKLVRYIESYDPDKNTWTIDEEQTQKMIHHAVVTIY